jgi:TatD DNase family protein
LIDVHCHIDLYRQSEQIIAHCGELKVSVLAVTTTPSAWKGNCKLVDKAQWVCVALGLHPQLAQERITELSLFDEILPDAEFVGEIGLDGTSESRKNWPQQVYVFEHVLSRTQNAGGRVMSVHSRGAGREVLDMLEKYPKAGTQILHWFSGSSRDLERAVRHGCWFSVGPVMLRTEKGRALVARMPRDRVLTETDGPFAQVKGRPLMPWNVTEAVGQLSTIWEIPNKEVEELLLRNLQHLLQTTKKCGNWSTCK